MSLILYIVLHGKPQTTTINVKLVLLDMMYIQQKLLAYVLLIINKWVVDASKITQIVLNGGIIMTIPNVLNAMMHTI